ncbi:hypothetical protein GCK72_017134 [Caenorhabditis remanei]|uniref:Uncharacterized protein n=1 Tax=Caenorhabditis remanei TaxID=31234 RepID=A0A6A5G726_CAERE|nr:hypothetical protein GCK72_017134 [Caenorhabditis remanei]KAF1750583.1 hypothetical protein GCK72_017134 [Caenorhabditis remanei]
METVPTDRPSNEGPCDGNEGGGYRVLCTQEWASSYLSNGPSNAYNKVDVMKILIPPKEEAPGLIFTLFERVPLDDSRIGSQQQVVSLSKLLIKQFGKLREDSKPTEEESLQLENLRNTLNTQWKEKRDSIGDREVYVCYAKIILLLVLTFLCVVYTICFSQILAVNYTWYRLVIIMEILVSLVVLFNILKLRRRIIAEKQSEKKLGPERQVVLEKMNDDYSEQLEKCMDFYSKEVMPLKEEARTLDNRVFLLIIISMSIFLMNTWTLSFYGTMEAIKELNHDEIISAIVVIPMTSIFMAIGACFVLGFLEYNEIEI